MEFYVILILASVIAAEISDIGNLENFIIETKQTLRKKYRPRFHVSVPEGWVNGPAGFVYFKGLYHLFYQYYPYHGAWGPIQWGHAASEDLINWFHYPPVLIPKEPYEKHGCLAGTAVVHNNYLTVFYTGNVVTNNRTIQTQNIAISADGVMFQKYLYNPVIKHSPNNVDDFRNPKVWRYRNTWYMLVGTTTKDNRGRLMLYISTDMFNWQLHGTMALSFDNSGFIWEKPDLFELDGLHVLVLSIQGIQTDGYRFKNLCQCIYVTGRFNYIHPELEDMEISMSTMEEVDYGHDFYAAQTTLAPDGRRLLVAWLGMWESELYESKAGWAGMLTIIREIKMSPQGRLLMFPLRELTELRTEILEDAWYRPGESFPAGTRTFELLVNSSSVLGDAELILRWKYGPHFAVFYSSDRNYLSVSRGGIDSTRRVDWTPRNRHLCWRIFVDRSSVEVFTGDGEVVFTSRFYPNGPITIEVGGDTFFHIIQYKLKRGVGFNGILQKRFRNHIVAVSG